MNALDVVFLIVVVSSVVAGLVSGLARVVIGLLSAILAVVLAFWFYGIPAAWFRRWFDLETAAYILGFLAVFGSVLAMGSAISALAAKIFKLIGLSWLDRLAGGVFGLVRGAAIVAALVAVLTAFSPKPRPGWMVESQLMPYAMGAAGVFSSLAPYELRENFAAGAEEVRRIWKKPKRLQEITI